MMSTPHGPEDSSGAGWIGRGLPRVDGPSKVNGRATYPQDVSIPNGCLHAATLRAPIACARIESIDTAAALRVPGVVRILTAADVGGTNRFGLSVADQPVLAERWVRGTSDVVALVIGTDAHAAGEGARALAVSFDPQPGVFDAERALEPGAPLVHPDRSATEGHPNLLAEREVETADVEVGFRDAHLVVESTYRTARVEHAFLGPEAGIARPDEDGGLILQVATQWPEDDLRQAAVALGEPIHNLRIVQETIGGAFGGREDISVQILLLLAARVCEAPVRMVWDRSESIRGHGKRHPFRIEHRLACDSEGRFLAATADVLIDAGCYTSTSRQLLDNALVQVFGPYAIPAARAKGRAVFTNNPYTCAFRGFGVNQVVFAMEQQVNRLATGLGLDPYEIRRRNLPAGPRVLASGCEISGHGGLERTLDRALEVATRTPLDAPDSEWAYGRGVASAMKNCGFGLGFDDHATAEVTLSGSTAHVRIGAAEVGQGIETVLTQIAATALDLDPAGVQVEWRDSRAAPEAGSTSASRQTIAAGNAVLAACESLRARVAEHDELAQAVDSDLTERCTWRFPETTRLEDGRGPHLSTFGWSTIVADVAVDTLTGEVRVVRIANAVDAGRVINPVLARGQVEGGAVMGQGYALLERFALREGMPESLGFEACCVPTSMDAVPDIETVFVEHSNELGPFGARGIGEVTMIGVVPAITAAIHAACGVWIDDLPASPERVLEALNSRER